MKKDMHVRWCIEVDAETPREAAKRACEIMRDPRSYATVFGVYPDYPDMSTGVLVDLLQEDE